MIWWVKKRSSPAALQELGELLLSCSQALVQWLCMPPSTNGFSYVEEILFFLSFVVVYFRFVRVLRLLRILRVAKIGRYYSSLQLIRNAIRSKMEELILTTVVLCLVLVMASSVMYYCEHGAQPEAFPNIPATMWWAVVTLTTVGYGDVFPVTVLGKIFASVIAISGIGMFALPTGIIGAGFVEEIQKNKPKGAQCPHCGKDI